MMSKRAASTLGFTVFLALVIVITGLLSHGAYIRKAVPLASAMAGAGVTSAFALIQKGKKADQECDERETYIRDKSMKFTFYVTLIGVVGIWSWEVTRTGTYVNSATILLYVILGAFLLSYAVNKFRL